MSNTIFSRSSLYLSNSKHKNNRVEQLAQDVAQELNTYKNLGVFKTYGDTYIDTDGNGNQKTQGTAGVADHPGTPGVRSLFNKYSAALTGNAQAGAWENGTIQEAVENLVVNTQEHRITTNTPLLDTPETRKKLQSHSGCTVRELVQASHKGYFGRAAYSFADFMYCKHLGKVSNNYLITIRRFPTPVSDAITPLGVGSHRLRKSSINGFVDTFAPIGTMVTWFGVSGNDMKSILKYSYSMPFDEKNAQWETISQDEGNKGILQGLEALANSKTRSAFASGTQVDAVTANFGNYFGLGSGFRIRAPQEDSTKIYGPIDRVKSAYMRSSVGLKQDHKFTLVFEYELKAYNGINPRQAMLDLLASIFSVTYTTGNFWGGDYKSAFIGQSSVFQNLQIFKTSGGFTDFMESFMGSAKTIKDSIGELSLSKIAQTINSLGGMLIGGLLNAYGRPNRYYANSLITGAPVGLWHVTFGNPKHPIMSLGNLILTNTTIEHYGALGLDDFPTQLRVTCEFDRGKPRDQRGLEQMYMGGHERIFHSMEGALGHVYSTAKLYKENKNSARVSDADTTVLTTKDLSIKDLRNSKKLSDLEYSDTLQYYFGDSDMYAIVKPAMEQGRGMSRKGKQEENEANKRSTTKRSSK